MPPRPRLWRITLWAALVPTILLILAAAANMLFGYGIVTPTGRFLCWADSTISIRVNRSFDSLEFIGDWRSRAAAGHSPSQWATVCAVSDQHVDVPAWLAPLPTLGICILADTMLRAAPHPRCRKCRYDLRGLPPAPSGKTICPECGAEAAP